MGHTRDFYPRRLKGKSCVRVRFDLFFKGMLRKKVNVCQCRNIRFINYMIEFS